MEHPYFDRSIIPRAIPLIALTEVPEFSKASPYSDAKSSTDDIYPWKSPKLTRGGDSGLMPPQLVAEEQRQNNQPQIPKFQTSIQSKPPSLPPRALPSADLPPRSPMALLNKISLESPNGRLARKMSRVNVSSPAPSTSLRHSSSSWVSATPEKQSRSSTSRDQENKAASPQIRSHPASIPTAESPSMSPSLASNAAGRPLTCSLPLSAESGSPVKVKAHPNFGTSVGSTSSPLSKQLQKQQLVVPPPPTAPKPVSGLEQVYLLLQQNIKKAAELAHLSPLISFTRSSEPGILQTNVNIMCRSSTS